MRSLVPEEIKNHTEYMKLRFPGAVSSSSDKTVCYQENDIVLSSSVKPNAGMEMLVPRMPVDACLFLYDNYHEKTVVINFAHKEKDAWICETDSPAGRLYGCSTLYPVLSRMRAPEEDAVIYTPGIICEEISPGMDLILSVDITTCAAPGDGTRVKEQLTLALKAAAMNEADTLIISDWRCGGGFQEPEEAADIFYRCLAKEMRLFKKVYIPIAEEAAATVFRRVLGGKS